MSAFNWQEFLSDYSTELAGRTDYLDLAEVPLAARKSKWLGYPPATEGTIAATESKLGIQLPAELRAFYRVTNGWMFCGHSVYDIRPIQELRWLRDADPGLWSLCEVDPDPLESDDPVDYEMWYDDGIKICRSLSLNTRGDDSTLLYDPETNIPEHELRYGTIAAWNPGMEWTARTFAEFFQQERETLPGNG